jgi:hypothetical protein
MFNIYFDQSQLLLFFMLHKLIMFDVETCIQRLVAQSNIFPTQYVFCSLRQRFSKEIFRTIRRYLQQDMGDDAYLRSTFKLPCMACVFVTPHNPRGLCCNVACNSAEIWSKTLCNAHMIKFAPKYVVVKDMLGNDLASVIMTYLV